MRHKVKDDDVDYFARLAGAESFSIPSPPLL
jgi:hypothetical protein